MCLSMRFVIFRGFHQTWQRAENDIMAETPFDTLRLGWFRPNARV